MLFVAILNLGHPHRGSCAVLVMPLVISAVFVSVAPASAQQTVLTLREAEFRNRWAGPQEDRIAAPQYFEPGGGLDDELAKSKKDEVVEAEPGFEESLDTMADNIQRGLRFGPLDFNLA